MPSLSGSLIDVTSAPSDATEVWIRAADGRVSGANVVLEETRRVPVSAGKFTVNVLPGRAHLVVIHAGMSQEHVPLLVQDGMTTIAEAVRLGSEDWEEYSPSQAEQIKAELAAEVAKAATSAQAAQAAQQAAEQARTDTQNALSTKADKVHTHAWSEIDGKPTVFPPATHTHTTAQVTGLDTALAGKASTGYVDTAVAAAIAQLGRKPIYVKGSSPSSGSDIRFDFPIQGPVRGAGNGFQTDGPVQVTFYGLSGVTITFRAGVTGSIKTGQSIVLEPTGTVYAASDMQGNFQAVFQPL